YRAGAAAAEDGGMSLYGLPESEVATLIRALVGAGPDGSRRGDDGLDRDAIAERFARVAWGLIAEPGDGDAGRIVAALGVARALELLVERSEPAAVDAEVRTAVGAPAPDDAGGSTDDGGFADAIARWMPRLESVAVLRALRQGRRFGARHVVPGDPE